MSKQHVKKGDEVVVLTGKDRGKRGKVISVNPGASKVVVEGVRIQKHHVRRSQQHPEGALVDKEGAIDWSNVMLASKYDSRRSKQG